jgi:hypothetical protein
MLRMLRKIKTNKKEFLRIFGIFFKLCSEVRIKMAPERGLYENPDKISLGEPKKSPHREPFCQNTPLRGLSGVLLYHT